MSTLGPQSEAPVGDGGEWELLGRDMIRTKVRLGADGKLAGGHIVAQFWTSPTPEHAALMVAAPELLEALRELNDALNDGLCNSGIPGFDSGRLGRAQDRADALIAKAEGRS